jgi:hypothetical protein
LQPISVKSYRTGRRIAKREGIATDVDAAAKMSSARLVDCAIADVSDFIRKNSDEPGATLPSEAAFAGLAQSPVRASGRLVPGGSARKLADRSRGRPKRRRSADFPSGRRRWRSLAT